METFTAYLCQWEEAAGASGLTIPAPAEICKEQSRNDNWQGKTKVPGMMPLKSHSVRYNFCVDYLGMQPGQEVSDTPPE
jgi:hypothetical protein